MKEEHYISFSEAKNFEKLVKYAEGLAEHRQYEKVLFEVLSEHLTDTGWTENTDYIYKNPETIYQIELTCRMIEVIRKTVKELLNNTKPTNGFIGFIIIESIVLQIQRLGIHSSNEIIDSARKLIKESYELGASEKLSISTSPLDILEQTEILVKNAQFGEDNFEYAIEQTT